MSDEILNRILSRIPEKYDIDPATPIYVFEAAAAKEFEIQEENTENAIRQFSPLTQDREHLIKDASVYGFSPTEATPSVVEGEFNLEMRIGERFSRDQINFYVAEYLRQEDGYFYYSLISEEVGEASNVSAGDLVPIQTIPKLTRARLTRILILGEEAEETEDFRARYLDSFKHKPFCGNGADFMKEIIEYPGVGRAKVLRCLDENYEISPEHVGLVFTGSDYKAPTEELVRDVQEYFHPVGSENYPDVTTSGLGMAAISQLVHVHGVMERAVDISAAFSFSAGSDFNVMKATIEEKCEEYLEELRETWGDFLFTQKAKDPLNDRITIFRSQLAAKLLELPEVLDVESVSLGGVLDNLKLEWFETPILGEVTLSDIVVEPSPGDCPFNCPDCQCHKYAEMCARLS